MKNYYCYILWSSRGQKFYVGITEDVDHRLEQHNYGVSKWTKRFAGTWELVWVKKYYNLTNARKQENLLKRQKGGNKFYELTGLLKEDFR